MNSSKSNAHIRATARGHLNGHYFYAIITMFSYGMIAFGLNTLTGFLPSSSSMLQGAIAVSISFFASAIVYLLRFGLDGCFLKICCGQKVSSSDIFSKLLHPDSPTIVLAFVRTLIDFACLLPLSYVAQRILAGYTNNLGISLAIMITSVFIYINASLTLMPVGYLVNDLNEKTVLRVLLLSQWLMKGNKLRLLKMILYFVPLIVLGALPLFLGLFLVYPYKQCSETCLYLDITGEKSGS